MEVDYLQKEGDQEGTPVQQGVDLGDTLVQEGVAGERNTGLLCTEGVGEVASVVGSGLSHLDMYCFQ